MSAHAVILRTAANMTETGLRAGDMIGPYQLLQRLGAGAHATVFHARGPQGDVAIKVHARGDDAEGRRLVARFRREVSLLAKIDSPYVVRVFDYGEEDRFLYIVQEHVVGSSLTELFGHGPVSHDDARQIAVQLLGGLTAIHATGVIHRDIKPSNVIGFRDHSGRLHVRLIDFGVARRDRRDVHRGLTATAAIIGTVAYMAPEQTFGEEVTARSDIYSAGLVVLEALCGYAAVQAWQQDVLNRQLMDAAPPQAPASMPDDLARFVEAASAAFPHERLPTAMAARSTLTTASMSAVTASEASKPRSPLASIALVAVVAVASAAAIVLLLEEPSQPPPTTLRLPPTQPSPATPPALATITDAGVEPDLTPALGEDVECVPEKLQPGEGWVTVGTDVVTKMWGYVPTTHNAELNGPVIVALHDGVSQSPPALLQELDIYDVSEELGALILAPAGKIRTTDIDALYHQTKGTWHKYAVQQRWREVAEIAAATCADLDRVYLIGKRIGGRAAHRFACHAPVAGIATWAHRLQPDQPMSCPKSTGPIAHLVITGTEDPRQPLDGCADCDGERYSFDDHMQLLRDWNHCKGKTLAVPAIPGATCTRTTRCDDSVFACTVPAAGSKVPRRDVHPFSLSGVFGPFVRSNGTAIAK